MQFGFENDDVNQSGLPELRVVRYNRNNSGGWEHPPIPTELRRRATMADLKTLKGVSEQDRKMIADAEALLGPEPSDMGFVKNLFWGNVRQELVFPYPIVTAEEQQRCDALLARLDEYLRNEHPAIEIDQEQEIPRWVIDRLFEL